GVRAPRDGRVDSPGARLLRRHVRQEHRGEHPDPDDVHELPALSAHGEDRDRVVGEGRPCGAARHLRCRRLHRHLPGRVRVLRRGDGPDQAVGATGQLGAVRDDLDYRHRRVPLPWSEADGRSAVGKDSGDLAICPDLHRRHLHVADGPDGLRALRVAPALARLWRHEGPLGRRLHADAWLRDEGVLGDGAHFFRPHRHRVLDSEPARPSGLPAEDEGMTVPVLVRIGALVVATTCFYMYVGQMVPQKEVQPPAEVVLKTDLSPPEMAKVGRQIMAGKGFCLTCHTIGKTEGPYRFPDLANVAVRAKTREPGLSDVEYFAQAMYEPNAFIVPGFNPGMPTINRPPIGLTDPEILC